MVDEEAHLGRQVALLRVDGQDVVCGQGVVVEHGDQFTAEQLGLEVLTPGPAVQAGVMQMIYAGIKAGHPVPIETIEAAIVLLGTVVERLNHNADPEALR